MRLLDYACDACGLVVRDVWDDEKPEPCADCGKRRFHQVYLRAPIIDARNPFKVLTLGGPSFSSHHEMEKYAKNYRDPLTYESKPQIVMTKEEQQRRPSPLTMEEKLKRNEPQKREAFQKAKYRLEHGYKDYPKLPTEKELLK